MCGRYVSTRSPKELARLFRVTDWDPQEALAPSWNVAPTDDVWAVLERTRRDSDAEPVVRRQLRPHCGGGSCRRGRRTRRSGRE